jgi:hypothetical protein
MRQELPGPTVGIISKPLDFQMQIVLVTLYNRLAD